MDKEHKWKFFFNGYGWWLRIETPEELEQYLNQTDENRFGGAMMQVAYRRMENSNSEYSGIAEQLDILNQLRGEDLLTTTGSFRLECHRTYWRNLSDRGFVNINPNGGCNSTNWPMLIVVKRDKLIFPTFSRKDVVIKTWEMGEKKFDVARSNYKYHWYAYVGDVRLKDGEVEKWNSQAECEAFVNKIFGENGG
jgi:hypothetical protein